MSHHRSSPILSYHGFQALDLEGFHDGEQKQSDFPSKDPGLIPLNLPSVVQNIMSVELTPYTWIYVPACDPPSCNEQISHSYLYNLVPSGL